MPISQTAFSGDVDELLELAAKLDIETIEELRKVTNRLIDNPDLRYERRIQEYATKATQKWLESALTWLSSTLPYAYLRGVRLQDRELKRLVKNPKNDNNPIPLPKFGRQSMLGSEPSKQALTALAKYPEHIQSYSRFEATFSEAIRRTQLPYYNSTVQNYRDIARIAQTDAFVLGEKATRRELAQKVMDKFAGRGINVVSFPTGHKMSVEAFAEREARSYFQKVVAQGHLNRAVERGYDLVRINEYAGASPMCTPYQGRVFSISGTSEKYPPLDEAIFSGTWGYGGGIYHDYSYIKDMEAYTNGGWKYLKDLNGTEKILSLNPDTLEPEWSNIVRLHNYHHKGKMVHLKSHNFDLCVTPDHDLFIGYNGRQDGKRVTKYKFEKAEEAIKRAKFTQLRIPEWKGNIIKVPISGVKDRDFARLLAWYISDGYCEKPTGEWTKVCIRKTKEPHVSELKKILLPLGFKYSNGRFWIYNKEWANYFKQFGKSHEKFLPDWIKNNRKELIMEFLEAYIIGDGTKGNSELDGYKVDRVSYSTSSKRLADDLGECIIKGGFYPSFHLVKSKGVEVKHHNGTYTGNHDIWIINRNKTKESYYGQGVKAELIDYDDRCYCVTLEKNHVLWVRRNGKTTWSGNCGHSQSAYIEGVSDTLGELSDDPLERAILKDMGEAKGNEFIYERRQEQRRMEYQIRKLKRNQAGSLDKRDREKLQESIKGYQAKLREHIKENPFLKRNYNRESPL